MFPCHLNKDGHDVYGFDPPVALNCVCFYSGHVVVLCVTPVGLSDPWLQRAWVLVLHPNAIHLHPLEAYVKGHTSLFTATVLICSWYVEQFVVNWLSCYYQLHLFYPNIKSVCGGSLCACSSYSVHTLLELTGLLHYKDFAVVSTDIKLIWPLKCESGITLPCTTYKERYDYVKPPCQISVTHHWCNAFLSVSLALEMSKMPKVLQSNCRVWKAELF